MIFYKVTDQNHIFEVIVNSALDHQHPDLLHVALAGEGVDRSRVDDGKFLLAELLHLGLPHKRTCFKLIETLIVWFFIS